jgi:hypothetical protein
MRNLGLMIITLCSNSQKVVKMYFKGNHLLSLDHQVDPKTGVENGYYKQYEYSGRLEQEGFYKMGKKNGTWKTYNQYGKVNSIITYKNDTLNGIYKEWCGNDEWMCHDYIYKNGETIKEKTYYKNGKLEWDIDKEKGIYNHFSIKGEALQKTINGKTFSYSVNQDGEIQGIASISFDSLSYKYEYKYDYLWSNGIKGPLCLTNITKKQNDDVKENYFFDASKFLMIKAYSNGNMINDSTLFSNASLLYLSDPNKDCEKFGFKYNPETGLRIGNTTIQCLVPGSKLYKKAQIEYVYKKFQNDLSITKIDELDDSSYNTQSFTLPFINKQNNNNTYIYFNQTDSQSVKYVEYSKGVLIKEKVFNFTDMVSYLNKRFPITIFFVTDYDKNSNPIKEEFLYATDLGSLLKFRD